MSERNSSNPKSPSSYSIIDPQRKKRNAEKARVEAISRELRAKIAEFKRKRPISGIFPVVKKAEVDLVCREASNEDRLRKLIAKNLGENYVLFLRSGHPWAKFWVQLQTGIAVIPTSEYMSYIEGILDIKTDRENYSLYGNENLRKQFMKKYGFAGEDEVVEFLMCELQLAELMPMEQHQKAGS